MFDYGKGLRLQTVSRYKDNYKIISFTSYFTVGVHEFTTIQRARCINNFSVEIAPYSINDTDTDTFSCCWRKKNNRLMVLLCWLVHSNAFNANSVLLTVQWRAEDKPYCPTTTIECLSIWTLDANKSVLSYSSHSVYVLIYKSPILHIWMLSTVLYFIHKKNIRKFEKQTKILVLPCHPTILWKPSWSNK